MSLETNHTIRTSSPKKNGQLKQNCIIAAVGCTSLHRKWIGKSSNFDLHLIVYDNSREFERDSGFVSFHKGFKLQLVYQYLKENPSYLCHYRYFFLPDDDILMSTQDIEKIFETMEKYSLSIAQPALTNSYYTYDCTLVDKFTELRYTNFVEIMAPCFSREALTQTLFTFHENRSGWGSEFHWKNLIEFTGKEMAILDCVPVVHTRPVSSGTKENQNDLHEYIEKYHLKKEIQEVGYIPGKEIKTNDWQLRVTRDEYQTLKRMIDHLILQIPRSEIPLEEIGLFSRRSRLILSSLKNAELTGKRKFQDMAFAGFNIIRLHTHTVLRNFTLSEGLPGIVFLIEYLSLTEFIEEDTDDILEEMIPILNSCDFSVIQRMDLKKGWIGIAYYYLIREHNRKLFHKKPNELEREKAHRILRQIQASSPSFLLLPPDQWVPQLYDLSHKILLFSIWNNAVEVEKRMVLDHENLTEKLRTFFISIQEKPSFQDFFPILFLGVTLVNYYESIHETKKREEVLCEIKELLSFIHSRQFCEFGFMEFLRTSFICFQLYQITHDKYFQEETLLWVRRAVNTYSQWNDPNLHPSEEEKLKAAHILTTLISEKRLTLFEFLFI